MMMMAWLQRMSPQVAPDNGLAFMDTDGDGQVTVEEWQRATSATSPNSTRMRCPVDRGSAFLGNHDHELQVEP